MKSEQLVEKNGLSEDDGFRLQGEIDAFFLVENDEYPVKSNDNNVSSSSYSLKPKQGRGRPRSKNIVSSSMGLSKKSRGRPKGSKNKVTTMSAKTSEVQDVSIVSVHDNEDEDISKNKKRGRPKGSKNKNQVIHSTPSKTNGDETETDHEEQEQDLTDEEEVQVTSTKKRAKPSLLIQARYPGRTPKRYAMV